MELESVKVTESVVITLTLEELGILAEMFMVLAQVAPPYVDSLAADFFKGLAENGLGMEFV